MIGGGLRLEIREIFILFEFKVFRVIVNLRRVWSGLKVFFFCIGLFIEF